MSEASSAKNSNLGAAKAARNDEFYTQWADIEREMNAYLEYDADVFRDKVVLLPCDDPEWSNFTKYFALHFTDFGLRKLISTSYAPDSNPATVDYQPTLFETSSPNFDESRTHANGKLLTLERKDINGDGVIDIEDLQWEYLDGDGDFRSDEVLKLREEADIVITNPPFSLIREFVPWLVDGGVSFAVMGPQNSIKYNEIFPFLKAGQLWLGTGHPKEFQTPSGKAKKFGNILWFTNIDHGRRHQPLQLMTRADNLRFNKKLIKSLDGATDYQRYDNFDAIEVPFTDAIPSDYDGVMGVPISFLDKLNPDQFEILATSENAQGLREIGVRPLGHEFIAAYRAEGGTKHISAGGTDLGIAQPKHRTVYARILVRQRKV